MLGSNEKDEFTCDCGRIVNKIIRNVLNGHTKSCGDCSSIVKQWYQDNQEEIKNLKCPIEPGFILSGPIEALELVTVSHKPFRAVCPACKKEYGPRLDAVKQGRRLVCTCTHGEISKQAIEISNFVRLLGPHLEIKFEHKVNGLAYDILVTGQFKKLLIEYDGAHWHNNSEESLRMEARKEKNAIDSGHEFLRIKEVEWKKENRDNMKRLLSDLLTQCKS
jgi:hypothetical protein